MNRHSAVVLQGPGRLGSGQAPGKTAAAAEGDLHESARPHWQQRGRSDLEDLREARAAETESLHIQDPRRYFERAPAVGHTGRSAEKHALTALAIGDCLAIPGRRRLQVKLVCYC